MKPKREEMLITEKELDKQRDYMRRIREVTEASDEVLFAMVDTYGCQQNEADSERIEGCCLKWATASPKMQSKPMLLL